ncbi:MAG: ammonium transporter [Deltaproteobacteria bacterium]|jgi:Amt family ammonium transporter|nr:ammonium transporter [Deltaproteobacteria bacterium]
MDSGDNAFLLVSAALVVLMTPGLGLFYGGLGRRKNVVNNLMACIVCMGTCGVLWLAFGYSLSFSGDTFGIIGTFSDAFLTKMTTDTLSPYTTTVPSLTFVAFQMTFAMITPAIITGSVSGRMRFGAIASFCALWSLFVYYPLAHMSWGHGGLLAESLGSIDFAGGNVVHISSGISGLVLCLIVGRRRGYDATAYRIHNIPFVALGMALLWFGWYGFNVGSAGAADGLASHVFMTTSISTAGALLSWIFVDLIRKRKPSLISGCTGVVAGLVAITPAAGYVSVWAALIIGITAGPICYYAIMIVKKSLKFDDALDAFGCHGVGGIWGGIMTGVFCSPAINAAAGKGLIFGEFKQLGQQVASIVISIVIAAVGTLICAAIIRIFTPLRVETREELIGLDISQHGENAYPSFTGLD